jgi:hypothetical protein
MMAFAHTAWMVVEGAAVRIHNLVSLLHDAIVEARETRSRLEADLFRDRYRLSSKNDDDLPIAR